LEYLVKCAGLLAVAGVLFAAPAAVPDPSTGGARGTTERGLPADPCGPGRVRRSADAAEARDRSDLTPAQVAQVELELDTLLSRKQETASSRAMPHEIPVYFHVLHSAARGNLPDTTINEQIAVLNATYGGKAGGTDTGFSFSLKGVTRSDDASWYGNPEEQETAFKTKLHQGGNGTLNLYTANLGDQLLGWATFPWKYTANPVMDGVVVHASSVPGGPSGDFGKGYTATHEVGHWLGLYHTFQNGCESPGDTVPDTPDEREPSNGCVGPARDTCPSDGADPVHNYMDYSQDGCMNQFSPGQADRMRKVWGVYRT
jgi:hypothetical protein